LVRQKLQADILKLLPVSSSDQLADFFTKPLLLQPFDTLLFKLGMLNIYHSPACGGLLEEEENNKEKVSSLLTSKS